MFCSSCISSVIYKCHRLYTFLHLSPNISTLQPLLWWLALCSLCGSPGKVNAKNAELHLTSKYCQYSSRSFSRSLATCHLALVCFFVSIVFVWMSSMKADLQLQRLQYDTPADQSLKQQFPLKILVQCQQNVSIFNRGLCKKQICVVFFKDVHFVFCYWQYSSW